MSAAPDTILISRSPGETRSALLAGQTLLAVTHRRDGEIQPGAVYLGRVGPRVPGIHAVFVHIGDALPGLLQTKPPWPAEGKTVAVKVMVPPRLGKGAVLSNAGAVPAAAKVPAIVQVAPDPVAGWWALYRSSLRRIICAPRREAPRVQLLLGEAAPVETYTDEDDAFAAFAVDEAIEAALQPEVLLPCGGSLLIEATAAVTAIDVNSGPADPATANGEAIAAIALELRRRNIAGHIVVDVIPSGRRAALPRLLAKAVSDDPVPTQVAGLTPLGMIELTRQRLGLSLAETLLDHPPGVQRLSAASVAYRALRQAVRKAFAENSARLALATAPEVRALLQGPLQPALSEATDLIKGTLMVKARPDFGRERIDLSAS